MMKDPIISVKDLLAECVRKAGFIIVCAIVFAVALCGFKYVKDAKSLGGASVNHQIEFTKEQTYQIHAYVSATEQLDNIKEYIQDSIYMNCNPYAIDYVQIQFKVEGVSEVEQREVVFALRNHILNGGLATDLSEMDATIEAEYFSELLQCKSITNESSLDSGIVEIVMYAESAERAEEYMLWINDSVSSFVTQLNNKGVNGKVIKIEENQATKVDLVMIENKNKILLDLAQLEQRVADTMALLTVEQLAEANDILINDTADDAGTVVTKPSISIKYFVLGGILGCFIAVVWIAVLYVFTNTIKISEDIQNMYGLTCLGHLTCQKQNALDKIANKLFYPEKNFELGLQLPGIISKVVFCAKHLGVSSVVLVKDDVVMCDVLDEISSEIAKNGVACQVLDVMSLQDCSSEVKTVVYVSQLHKTKYQSVENKILFCKNQNINILGYITIK